MNKKKIIWRWIPGYKGRYRVSTHGKVKSYVQNPDGKVLKQHSNHKSEYLQIRLKHEDGNRYSHDVHRLVLTAFKGLPEHGLETRHLDGTRTNNRIDNLEWGTIDENVEDKRRHGTLLMGEDINTAKLTDDIVRHLRRTVAKYGASITYEELAEKYDVAPSTISNAVNRIYWKHVEGPDCSSRPRAVGTPPPALYLEKAQVIRDKYIAGSTSSTQLATEYGVSQATVSFVLNKKGHYKNLEGPDVNHTHRMGPGKVTDKMIQDIRHGYAVNQHYTTRMYEDKYGLSVATVHNIINAKGPYAYLSKKSKKQDHLSPHQIRLIRSMAAQGTKQKIIAAEFSIDQSQVSRVINKRGKYANV